MCHTVTKCDKEGSIVAKSENKCQRVYDSQRQGCMIVFQEGRMTYPYRNQDRLDAESFGDYLVPKYPIDIREYCMTYQIS